MSRSASNSSHSAHVFQLWYVMVVELVVYFFTVLCLLCQINIGQNNKITNRVYLVVNPKLSPTVKIIGLETSRMHVVNNLELNIRVGLNSLNAGQILYYVVEVPATNINRSVSTKNQAIVTQTSSHHLYSENRTS